MFHVVITQIEKAYLTRLGIKRVYIKFVDTVCPYLLRNACNSFNFFETNTKSLRLRGSAQPDNVHNEYNTPRNSGCSIS